MANLWFWQQRHVRTIARFLSRYLFGRKGQRMVSFLRLFYRIRMEVVLQSEHVGRIVQRPPVRVWVDGQEAFPRIELLLRRARHTIIIQMFIWKDDSTGQRIASVLLEAADRGVKVSLMKEVIGDFFEFHEDFLGTRTSDLPLWKRFWSHPNIEVVYAKHNDHTKVYIIDGSILLLAGMNISDEYRYDWHDYLVELRGEQFVEQFLKRSDRGGDGAVRLIMNTEVRKSIRPTVMRLLEHARESIVVEHCYVSDAAVIDLLIRRSKEGLRVVVIMPKSVDLHHHANLQSMARLIAEGAPGKLQLLLYPRIVHGKVILVDRSTLFLGSANLMTSSLDDMGEVNVLVESSSSIAVTKMREALRGDILSSEPLTSPPSLRWFARMLARIGL